MSEELRTEKNLNLVDLVVPEQLVRTRQTLTVPDPQNKTPWTRPFLRLRRQHLETILEVAKRPGVVELHVVPDAKHNGLRFRFKIYLRREWLGCEQKSCVIYSEITKLFNVSDPGVKPGHPEFPQMVEQVQYVAELMKNVLDGTQNLEHKLGVQLQYLKKLDATNENQILKEYFNQEVEDEEVSA